MTSLLGVLADLDSPQVTWITGVVSDIADTGFVTLDYKDGTIRNVAFLDQYTPVLGDTVQAISLSSKGVLILGSTNAPGSSPPAIVDQTPIIITSGSVATYGPIDGQWELDVLEQELDRVACWFYAGTAFTSLSPANLQLVEIEVLCTSGGPLELVAHQNVLPVGTLVLADYPVWVPPEITIGVTTWVELPLGWGQDLLTGDVTGIGVSSSGQSGIYTGTGRVRLTPLSVTM